MVIFLICRVIVLWYWKVNQVVDLLRSIVGLAEGMQDCARDRVQRSVD